MPKQARPIDGLSAEHGIVNTQDNPRLMGNTPSYPYGQPAVPVIYKNLIITGGRYPPGMLRPNVGAVGDKPAPWECRVTGKLVLEPFHTVPYGPVPFGSDNLGAATSAPPTRSGRSMSGAISTVDEKRGHSLHAAGRFPNNDRRSAPIGRATISFSSSLVAVDGQYRQVISGHFQVTHHDIWGQ